MGKFNEYSQKATPADNDTMMIYDATSKANKLSPFSGIWNWIVRKLTNAVISNLQTSNQTVLGAINELNSKTSSIYFNFEDVGKRSILNVVKSKNNGIFLLYTQAAPDSPATGNVSFTIVNKPAADYIYLYLYVYSNIYFSVANTKTDTLEWKRITSN